MDMECLWNPLIEEVLGEKVSKHPSIMMMMEITAAVYL